MTGTMSGATARGKYMYVGTTLSFAPIAFGVAFLPALRLPMSEVAEGRSFMDSAGPRTRTVGERRPRGVVEPCNDRQLEKSSYCVPAC